MSTLLPLTVKVLSIIARAIVSRSLSAFMVHGWRILGILAVGVMVAAGALRVGKRL